MSGKRRKFANHVPRRPMNRATIQEIVVLVESAASYASRALALSVRMTPADFDESSDPFWALEKYGENVEESIKQALSQLAPAVQRVTRSHGSEVHARPNGNGTGDVRCFVQPPRRIVFTPAPSVAAVSCRGIHDSERSRGDLPHDMTFSQAPQG